LQNALQGGPGFEAEGGSGGRGAQTEEISVPELNFQGDIGMHAANRLKDSSEDLLHAVSPEAGKTGAERQSSLLPFATRQKRFITGG
jgi:hypothetical protein